MFVDVLKRYLLIVWNFFFGQVSTESIKDSPEDKPPVQTDVVPPVEVNDDNVENQDKEDDDIEEIFDDEEEDDEEEVDELESEDEEVVVPKKPEDKAVKNDIPTKPSVPTNKIEEAKVPEVLPTPKDDIKKPEPPKVPEIGEKDKPKVDINDVKKTEAPTKLKPEFETGEREGAAPKVAAAAKDSFKSEFEIVEREDKDAPLPSKPHAELEKVERGSAAVKPVLPPPPPPPSVVKGDPATGPEPIKGVPKPETPPKATARVKFQEEDDDDDNTLAKGHAPAAVDFATLEKGEKAVLPPGAKTGAATGDTVGDFLSSEQAHGGQLLHRHHESIQDQQLDYSDSGEDLSDDDIEIDYEDDEDDEEVVEVRPLPPVARSVYKKND